MNLILSIVSMFIINTHPAPVGYAVGDKVENFSLTNTVDGKQVQLNDYLNKNGVIVVFTCNHCPYAKAYESRIMDLDKKYASLGYPVLAINSNDPVAEPTDSPDNMKKRAAEMKYSFPYLFDETQNIAKAFGATRTPHVFLLQKTSTGFVVSYIGAIDDNTYDISAVQNKYVESAISSLQNHEQPNPNFTKAIGCTIKWRE